MTTSIRFNHRQFNSHVFNKTLTNVTGTMPTLVVRAALANDAFETSPTWNDLTNRVEQVTITRGRQHQLGRMEAGTATLKLENRDGELWPNNDGGAYYPNILPGKRLNIRAQWGYGTYDIFTGFIEKWNPQWMQPQGYGAYMQVKCVDLIKLLSRFIIDDDTGYSSELTGTRINNVLDDYGFPSAWRDIAVGQTTLQATGAISETRAMEHLFLVQDSEFGTMFIDGKGYVVFHDRHTRLTDYDVSEAIFGDDANENKYSGLELSYGDEYIYNYVRVEREGGTAQTAEDSTSQNSYGKRGLPRSGLLMTSDNEALDQANYLKNKYRNPKLRTRTLTIYPGADPDNLMRMVLHYDLGTRITLRKNEASLDEDYHIEGITHNIDKKGGFMSTQWQLGPVDASFWQLGIVGASELGETTYLGY